MLQRENICDIHNWQKIDIKNIKKKTLRWGRETGMNNIWKIAQPYDTGLFLVD